MKVRRSSTQSGGHGDKIALPVWLARSEASEASKELVRLCQAHNELLRVMKRGELKEEGLARANVEEVRKAVRAFLGRNGLALKQAAVEATHEFLARERAGRTPDRHQFDLCYLCSPTVTLGLSRAMAMRRAAATFFQVENGPEPDAEFVARWNAWRAERGEAPVAWKDVAESAALRQDLREFVLPLVGSVCVDYPCRHLWRLQGVRFSREDVDKLAAAVLKETGKHWLGLSLE